MTLAHLLLLCIPSSLLALVFAWLLGVLGWEASLQARGLAALPLAFFIAIVLAWPLGRLLRFRPVTAYAGPCPGCRTRPPGWYCLEYERDRALLECGNCGTEVELWQMRKPPVARLSTAVPSYAVRWPEFLGIWRLVSAPRAASPEKPDARTIARIFYAVDREAVRFGALYRGIMAAAGGLDPAAPTRRELQASLAWLVKAGLVRCSDRGYFVAPPGRALIAECGGAGDTAEQTWAALTLAIERIEQDRV